MSGTRGGKKRIGDDDIAYCSDEDLETGADSEPLKTRTEVLDPPVLPIDFEINEGHKISFTVGLET